MTYQSIVRIRLKFMDLRQLVFYLVIEHFYLVWGQIGL